MADPSGSLWRGALAGVVGGLLAAGAMSLVHQVLPKPSAPAEEGEDATVKVADSLTRRLGGRPLPEGTKPMASQLVHYAFGGVVGAVYGGVAELVPSMSRGPGLAQHGSRPRGGTRGRPVASGRPARSQRARRP